MYVTIDDVLEHLDTARREQGRNLGMADLMMIVSYAATGVRGRKIADNLSNIFNNRSLDKEDAFLSSLQLCIDEGVIGIDDIVALKPEPWIAAHLSMPNNVVSIASRHKGRSPL